MVAAPDRSQGGVRFQRRRTDAERLPFRHVIVAQQAGHPRKGLLMCFLAHQSSRREVVEWSDGVFFNGSPRTSRRLSDFASRHGIPRSLSMPSM
jgi:hypothetical protein